MYETDVLIVGAGPAGLTLALDLGRHGVPATLIDSKSRPLRVPKMERSNPRTLEIYRRLGVIEKIRQLGYPAELAMDTFILTSLAEQPLLRLKYPSVNEARQAIADSRGGELPREPYQLISQYTLEPLLFDALKQYPNVTLLTGTECLSVVQEDARVVARVRRDGVDGDVNITARYLAACDGAGSRIRRQLHIAMEGRENLGTVTNIFFRCDELFDKSSIKAGRHFNFASVGASGGSAGALVCQDDRRHFAYHTQTPPTADLVGELRRLTGLDIHPQILFVSPWVQNMLVAQRHREGRVFLVGDANHVYIPAGGLGMNTGIGDAHNLAWKLAALVRGWGGPRLAESYDAERNPVARRNLTAVQTAVQGVIEWRSAWDPIALRDTPAGRAARAAFLEMAEPRMRRVYEMHGAELGYRYASSLVAAEDGIAPPQDVYAYRPTTWPGAHLPHVWLQPGRALYDDLGLGFSLLRLGGKVCDTTALERAFASIGAPLAVHTIPDPRIHSVLERDLVLVRPDLHVAWRGDALPGNPAAIAARAAGF